MLNQNAEWHFARSAFGVRCVLASLFVRRFGSITKATRGRVVLQSFANQKYALGGHYALEAFVVRHRSDSSSPSPLRTADTTTHRACCSVRCPQRTFAHNRVGQSMKFPSNRGVLRQMRAERRMTKQISNISITKATRGRVALQSFAKQPTLIPPYFL